MSTGISNLNEIIYKETLAANISLIEVKSEEITAKILPGQFVIIRVRPQGERIPLTVVKKDLNKKTVTLIFQVVGRTTELLSKLNIGDSLNDLVGPLEIDMPGFIKKIAEKDFESAIKILKDKNNLPAICGRLCPHETQCEIECVNNENFT